MRADILACWEESAISRLIRWITQQKVSHVAIMFTEEFVAQSLWRGVKLDKLEDVEQNYYVLRYEGLTHAQKDKIIKFLRNSIDAKYDFTQFIAIGLHKIFGTRVSQNSKKYICSELVYDAFQSVGIDICPQIKHKSEITPGDLLESPVLKVVRIVRH